MRRKRTGLCKSCVLPSTCVLMFQAGWKESHGAFVSELKNLQANGLSSLGPALKRTFDLLNVNRMQSGIDTYGQVG